MPFIYRNIVLSPADNESSLPALVAGQLGVSAADFRSFAIIRKGIDARRKPRVKLVYTIRFSLAAEDALIRRIAREPSLSDLEWQSEQQPTIFTPAPGSRRIVIAGFGPAGLFAALRLAEYGLTATLVERGQPVEERALAVQRFWRDGTLDPESNVQFGEGGAGTFSDGKLTCRSKDPLVPWVLERLADFGAPPEVRYLAKPHIGTDRLRKVVSSIRRHLIQKGFTIRFGCRLTDLQLGGTALTGIVINDSEEIPCDLLILATGHSARDTYEMLMRHGVPMEQKPFAMGLRVEHPQELIDRIQFGGRQPGLPAADYALTFNNKATGRSAYSFCMCPGGIVIAGSSEEGGVVTNGMSGQKRNSPFANSALVVNVRPEDFNGGDALAGVRFQRRWERLAFDAGGGGYRAPAQNLLDFMGLPGAGSAAASYRPGIVETGLDRVLPPYVISTLREGISHFGRCMRGFVTAEATLIGIESRTSAPLRILRGQDFRSIGIEGLYPAGEGAGYAGGIMSSAVDGIKIADRIAAELSGR